MGSQCCANLNALTTRYGAFSIANQNQGSVVLNCTARNLNTLLFRVSAGFDNKIKTKDLIFPSFEDHIPPSKEFYWYAHWQLAYDFDTTILFTNYFGN